MSLFKKKKKDLTINAKLDQELRHARSKGDINFYFPLNKNEVSKAIEWGIKNRVSIKPGHIINDITYYKFYGYLFEK